MTKSNNNYKKYIAVSLVCLVLGLLLSFWFKAYMTTISAPKSTQNQNLVNVIEELETETLALESSIDALRTEITGGSENETYVEPDVDRLRQELSYMQTLAGQTAVTGSGVIITIDDNTLGAEAAKLADPTNYYAESYIIHDSDLRYILNDISYTADAISINGQRIVSTSDIRCVGTVIMINSTRVAPPYEISIIGNSFNIEAALSASSQYNYLTIRNMPTKVTVSDSVVVPAYSGTVLPKYAQAVSTTEIGE